MSDVNKITRYILTQKHFKVKLTHYDGASQTFWPNYKYAADFVSSGDVIAFDYGGPCFAVTRTVAGDLVSLTVIPKSSQPNPTIHIKIHRNRVLAIMQPE